MRSYAEFLMDLRNDQAMGADLLEQADQLERVTSEHETVPKGMNFLSEQPVSLNIFDDRNAVIRIECNSKNLGLIKDANAAMCKYVRVIFNWETLGCDVVWGGV